MAHTGRPWRDYKPPPSGPVWNVIQAGNTYWMLVAALDLGVFDALEETGRQSAAALAESLGVSAIHLQHLLDSMVTFGFLDQIHDEYALTETAERYLCTNGPPPWRPWSRSRLDRWRTGSISPRPFALVRWPHPSKTTRPVSTGRWCRRRLRRNCGWRPGLACAWAGSGCRTCGCWTWAPAGRPGLSACWSSHLARRPSSMSCPSSSGLPRPRWLSGV